MFFRCNLLVFELRVVKICIETAFCKQLFVRTFFDDVALVQDENHVRIFDCREAVRDDKRRLVLHEFFKRLLNLDFRASVDRACRFVENEHRGMSEHNSCDAKKLFLSLRDIPAVIVEYGIVTVFKVHDEVVDMSGLCGFDDFFLGCVGIAVGNVFSYSAFLSQVS